MVHQYVSWFVVLLVIAGCAPAGVTRVDVPETVELEPIPEPEPSAKPEPASGPEPASEPELVVEQPDVAPEHGVIVVCPPEFREPLETWIDRRRREGLAVTVIDSQPTAERLKASLEETPHSQCRYILLVGDAAYTPEGESVDSSRMVPTCYRDADVTAPHQESPRLPGDYSFGDFGNDGVIDAAVGRLPVKSADQLVSVIERIISYEDSRDFGSWRSRVDLIAGIGGFSPMIDGAIEMVASGIITGNFPGWVQTRITHASPTSDFHPRGEDFTNRVLQNYQDGSRFWVYAGHGWVNELDRVPPTPYGRPVLSNSDVPDLNRPADAATIAILLACYSGAFDMPADCLAERMLLEPTGPIAVLSGSRVTMPYGNAAIAIALIDAVHPSLVDQDNQTMRLGDAWLQTLTQSVLRSDDNPELMARRMMIDGVASLLGGGARTDDERLEHLWLYNWLGDPTMRLASVKTILIDDLVDAVMTADWTVTGASPVEGTVTVEIHRRLGSPAIANTDSQSKYDATNDTLLFSQTSQTTSGRWSVEFKELDSIAETVTTALPIIVRAYARDDNHFAAGSKNGWLRSAAKEQAAK